jgi:hypothetical protein
MYLGLAPLKFVRLVLKFEIFSEQEVKNYEKTANSLKSNSPEPLVPEVNENQFHNL